MDIKNDVIHVGRVAPPPPLLVRWSRDLARLSPARAWMWGLFLLAAIAVADHVTGYRFELSRFHMAPVALLSWVAGRTAGGWMAAIGLVVWAVGERMTLSGGSLYPHIWNAFVRAVYFAAAVLILSALREALNEEESLARTDFLTGVANRRHFTEVANGEIRRARRYGAPFIVAYIDVDDFKKVNDRFGHAEGDALLKLVAGTMRDSLRAVDTVSRLGGDEFAVLLPETGGRNAREIIGKMRARLAEAVALHAWTVTFSIGAVSYPTPPASVDEMIKTADQLMYSVKSRGKNNVGYATAGSAMRRRD